MFILVLFYLCFLCLDLLLYLLLRALFLKCLIVGYFVDLMVWLLIGRPLERLGFIDDLVLLLCCLTLQLLPVG